MKPDIDAAVSPGATANARAPARRPVRTLLFSTLYPSAARPNHGVFVETRLRELLKGGEVESKVVAPVPWFFSQRTRFGEYASFARTPLRETRWGIDVLHPRFVAIPKVGMTVAPLCLALGAAPACRKLIAEGFDFDLIDAHYYYPDGVAAALLAHWFGKPFTVTARGSDLNLIRKRALPGRLMRWTARRAQASIGVSAALVDVLRSWQIEGGRLHVMRNGVDLRRFAPRPRDESRRRLRLDGSPLLLSVGNLVGLKGHGLVIEALALLSGRHPRICLAIVGTGPEQARLAAHAEALGVASRVVFAGRIEQAELPDWYSAADALVLASSREGWANVLLESMACGTPVVATRVGGTPEVVADPRAGRLVEHRDPQSIASVVEALLTAPPERASVREYAEGFSWDSTTQAQTSLFRSIAASDPSHA